MRKEESKKAIVKIQTIKKTRKYPKYKLWSDDERTKYVQGIRLYGRDDFNKISELVGTRSAKMCAVRCSNLLGIKNPSAEERSIFHLLKKTTTPKKEK